MIFEHENDINDAENEKNPQSEENVSQTPPVTPSTPAGTVPPPPPQRPPFTPPPSYNPYNGGVYNNYGTPNNSYGYSYDYSAKPTPKKKNSTGILAIILVVALFAVSICMICIGAALLTRGVVSEKTTTLPETEGVTLLPPSTSENTENTEIPDVTPSTTDDVIIYGDNENWINKGNITSDDAYINATYQTIDSVVAITTETASYNSYYGNYVSTGAGSGVIFAEEKNEKGEKVATYIITNNHVVSGASKIKVTLTNGDTHQATLIGTDSQTDIAVIKISAVGLKLASLGDSSKILLSQPVIAIGNPLGELANSVTDGRISGLERIVTIDGVEMSLLQTNAAVNPGNSGGGLFGLNGDLIGIVNAKSSGDAIEGIGFAIPINTAKAVAEDIIKYGYVSGRPSIGIFGSLVTKDNYTYYKESDVYNFIYQYYYANNNSILEGFYIENDDSVNYASADGEKFQKGDVVAEIGGTKVKTSADLTSALSKYEIGDTVTVSVYRLVKTTGVFGRDKTEIQSFDVTVILGEKKS